jgi:hypothetical protein
MGHKPICWPFASAGPYRADVDDPAQSRQYLGEMRSQYPALFPQDMDQGFPLHDSYVSSTQDLLMRRITLPTTAAVCTLRPSCVMPDMIARTEEVEKALSLRQWGGPVDAVVEAADTVTLEPGYGECAKAAKALAPDDQARSVCTDGWEATRQAWRGLFPQMKVVLCFLHSILKSKTYCAGQWRHRGLDRAWPVDQAATKRQFSQRLRRVAEWTLAHLSGAVAQMGLKRCRRRSDCTPASDGPQAHRTSNAVDRLLDYQDRRLDARRDGHGTTDSARRAGRAMALQWNLHPYGARLRRDQPSRVSPLHDLNGLPYPSNWLPNLWIASSLGGLRH